MEEGEEAEERKGEDKEENKNPIFIVLTCQTLGIVVMYFQQKVL